jgi:hypothetical protein
VRRVHPIVYRPLLGALLVLALPTFAAEKKAENADDFLIVDCLLPSQIRQLGLNMTFMAPRQAIKTTAHECALRGGEFSRGDAGGPAGLRMWLPAAEKGDPVAQTYVGEIFERGLAGKPDYAAAVVWYRRAAEQNNSRAAIALGSLLEQGLGAPRDEMAAAKLFRRAAGLPEDLPGGNDRRVKELSSQLAAAKATNVANQAKLNAQSKRIAEREAAVQRDRDALAALQAKLKDAQAQPAAARPDDGKKLDQTLSVKQHELEASKSQVAALQTKVASLEKQAIDPAELQRMQSELDAARAARAAQQIESDRLAAELRNAQAADASRAREQQNTLDQALAAKAHELDASTAQVAALHDKIATMEKQAVDPAQLDKLRADLDGARGAMSAQQKESDRLKSQLQASQAASAAHERELKQKLDQALTAKEHELEASTAQIATLRARVAGFENAPAKPAADPAELAALRQQLATARAAETAQQSETDRLKHELQSTQTGGAQREQELRKAVEQLQRDIATRQSGIAAKDAEIEKLKTQVAQLGTTRSIDGKAAPAAMQPLPLSIEDFGHYHALVIGIDHYKRLKELKTPISDAKAIAEVLKTEYGYDVTTLFDADRFQILETLNRLRQTLTDKDNLLIYYAGHGELDQVNQRGNWLPVDAEPDSSANWISNIQITDILNAMAARQILVVADSCYSGTLTRGVAAQLNGAQSDTERVKWYKIMVSKPSRVALTSGGLEPVVDNSSGNHSLFAALLIKVLESNASVLSAQEVYSQLEPAVSTRMDSYKVHQVPEYAPIKMAGHEAGDFLFVKHAVR